MNLLDRMKDSLPSLGLCSWINDGINHAIKCHSDFHLAWLGLVRQLTFCDLKSEFSQLWLFLGNVFREQVSVSLSVLLDSVEELHEKKDPFFFPFNADREQTANARVGFVTGFHPWVDVCLYHFIRGWNCFIIKVAQSPSQSLLLQSLVGGGVQCCLRSSNFGGGCKWAAEFFCQASGQDFQWHSAQADISSHWF